MATENTPPRDYSNDQTFLNAWARMDPVLRRECLRMERETKEGMAIAKDRAVGRPKRDLGGFYGLELLEAEIYRLEQAPQRDQSKLDAAVKGVAALRKQLESDENRWQQNRALDVFHDMAAANGQTLADVLRSYMAMEQLLRDDIVGGIFLISEQGGIDPVKMLTAVLNAPDNRQAAH